MQPCVARRVSGAAQSLGPIAQARCKRTAASGCAPGSPIGAPSMRALRWPVPPHARTFEGETQMRPEPNDESRASGEPAEGRPDLGIPGADRPELPPAPEDQLPERLSERIHGGEGQGIATGEPDLKPDVEVPEVTM